MDKKQTIFQNAYIEDKAKEFDKHSENKIENKAIHINARTLESFDNSTKITAQSGEPQEGTYTDKESSQNDENNATSLSNTISVTKILPDSSKKDFVCSDQSKLQETDPCCSQILSEVN